MRDLTAIIREEEEKENNRWARAVIKSTYKPPEEFHPSQILYFTSQDQLFENTVLRLEGYEGIAVVKFPARDGASGCTLFGRCRNGNQNDVVFFAYQEQGQDYINVRPPRIEVDENGIRLKSGETARLMHQRPLPKE